MSEIRAFQLRVGDVIDWAGHRTTVRDIRGPRRTSKRPGRLIDALVDGHGDVNGLHYYDDEVVWVWEDGPRPHKERYVAPPKARPPSPLHPVTRTYRNALARRADLQGSQP